MLYITFSIRAFCLLGIGLLFFYLALLDRKRIKFPNAYDKYKKMESVKPRSFIRVQNLNDKFHILSL